MAANPRLAELNRSRRVDLSGQKFHHLTVLKTDGKKGLKYTYECLCDCGNIRSKVVGENLTRGKSKSCGCRNSDSYCPPNLSQNEYFNRVKTILLKRRKINGDCWEYTGQKNILGYGSKNFIFPNEKKRKVGVHRISYYLWKGEIPTGMFVLHDCDNPSCFNPCHLKLGTHHDNMVDKRMRSRNKGSCSRFPRLTEEKVSEIKLMIHKGVCYREISQIFNTSYETVSDIKTGKRWRDVR